MTGLNVTHNAVSSCGAVRKAVCATQVVAGQLPRNVLPMLRELRAQQVEVLVVTNAPLCDHHGQALGALRCQVIVSSDADGYAELYSAGLDHMAEGRNLDGVFEVILCSDQCFGPVTSTAAMFAEMARSEVDYWGVSSSVGAPECLFDFWLVLRSAVFASARRSDVFDGSAPETAPETAPELPGAQSSGVGISKRLNALGFSGAGYRAPSAHPHPIAALEKGVPIFDKSLIYPHSETLDGQNRLLTWLRANAAEVYDMAVRDSVVERFEAADRVGFSVIMPSFNRVERLGLAIDSVLRQSHENLELILVDDGSTDATESYVKTEYAREIETGRLIYCKLARNQGPSCARNIGVSLSSKEWIAYADSDNRMRPYFLTVFANHIVAHPGCAALYGKVMLGANPAHDGIEIGRTFDRASLETENYIDMGAFVHQRRLSFRYGGFDPDLRRLEDWDLILRYTRDCDPIFVPIICLDYDDDPSRQDRLSLRENLHPARARVIDNNTQQVVVTTIIPSFNHQAYIAQAIESAIAQRGDFRHEILVSDDGSRDRTPAIIRQYCAQHPDLVFDLSSDRNLGISGNYKKLITRARGSLIAVLEGDDFWHDPDKLAKQAAFLTSEPRAQMVFSKIRLHHQQDGSRRVLQRQTRLPPMLTGKDLAASAHLNPIVNLSSVMVRASVLKALPERLYRYRLSEYPLAFHIDRIGGHIGFIDEVLGTYRVHDRGVWSGASEASKIRQSIRDAETALSVARLDYAPQIEQALAQQVQNMTAWMSRPAQRAPRKIAVVVLGMHRSGTSMLGGLLDKFGLRGPNTLAGPNDHNPKGYFESEPVYELNDEILAQMGSCWFDPDPLPKDWMLRAEMQAFERRAVQVIKSEYKDAAQIYLKDPRLCRLFPFWGNVLKECGYFVSCVQTLRHPAEVTSSLATRPELPVDVDNAEWVWLRHMLEAERNTRGYPRQFTSYEQLLKDPRILYDALRDAFDLPSLALPSAEISGFVDARLRHHTVSGNARPPATRIGHISGQVYEIFERWALGAERATDRALLDHCADELDRLDRRQLDQG